MPATKPVHPGHAERYSACRLSVSGNPSKSASGGLRLCPRRRGLFSLRETRHVQIADQIGPVLLIVAVRDGKADLMEAGGPAEPLRLVRVAQAPRGGRLVEQSEELPPLPDLCARHRCGSAGRGPRPWSRAHPRGGCVPIGRRGVPPAVRRCDARMCSIPRALRKWCQARADPLGEQAELFGCVWRNC